MYSDFALFLLFVAHLKISLFGFGINFYIKIFLMKAHNISEALRSREQEARGLRDAAAQAQAQLSQPQVLGPFPYLGRGGLRVAFLAFKLLTSALRPHRRRVGEGTHIYHFRWIIDALRLSISWV